MAEWAARAWRKERRSWGRRGGRAAVFDGGQETSRVMNFSAGCIRRVTRTRTGVRKQVVTDICSAKGPGCPCHLLPPSTSVLTPRTSHSSLLTLSLTPSSLAPSLNAAARSQTAGLSADADERQRDRKWEWNSFFFIFLDGLTFSAGGPSTPKVVRGWTQLQCRTCPRHK